MTGGPSFGLFPLQELYFLFGLHLAEVLAEVLAEE
jgi:hypothetical protein